MTPMASQITSLTVVYSAVYSDADQRKHQSSAWLAFVWKQHAYSIKPNDLLELTRHFTPLQLQNSRDLSINLNWSQIKQNLSVFPFSLSIYLNENVNLVSDYMMISVSYADTQGNFIEYYRMLSVVRVLDAYNRRKYIYINIYVYIYIHTYIMQYLCYVITCPFQFQIHAHRANLTYNLFYHNSNSIEN